MMPRTRRSVYGRLTLAAPGSLLALAHSSFVLAQPKPLKQIYVGVASVSMGNIIIYVAKEARLFEKYGLYADPVAMRGSGEASKAMIGGSIQLAPYSHADGDHCGTLPAPISLFSLIRFRALSMPWWSNRR